MQSVSITTKVVSLIPAHGEVYSTQHYVGQVSGFLRFPTLIKLTAMIIIIIIIILYLMRINSVSYTYLPSDYTIENMILHYNHTNQT